MSDFFDDELLLSMERNLNLAGQDDTSIEKAAQYLSEACSILQEQGFNKKASKLAKILNKLAIKKEPPTLTQLMTVGISQRDLKEFEKNGSIAVAKINLALYSLGYSAQEVVSFLGNRSLSENKAYETLASNGANNFQTLSQKKHQDWHTKGLTSDKEVKNLKDHGTVFNMANDCAIDLPPKKEVLEPEDMDEEFSDMLKSFDFNATDDEIEEQMSFEDEKD